MYTVRFTKPKFTSECNHTIMVASAEGDLDYHSSSPIHFGVCPECHLAEHWEIRHLDYVVLGVQNKDLKLRYYVKFESLFTYDKDYTEKEIVERLAEVYQPQYIANGRRCLYSASTGINEEVLWK